MMTSPASNSVLEEMKAVFTFLEAHNIGSEPLEVSTNRGRKYEVCYVDKTSSGVWVSTRGDRYKGYFKCEDCSLLIPGGDWFQITLKNGASSEPVVRLLEIVHHFKFHPQILETLATEKTCVSVFERVIQSRRGPGLHNLQIDGGRACITCITFVCTNDY